MLGGMCALAVFIRVGWVWPMPSSHSPPGSFRDQHTAPRVCLCVCGGGGGVGERTISGAEAGEKQSNWSWEPSVITPFSSAQRAVPWSRRRMLAAHGCLRWEERQNWDGADHCCGWAILIPLEAGRKSEGVTLYPAGTWVQVLSVRLASEVSYSSPVALSLGRTDQVEVFVLSLLYMKRFSQGSPIKHCFFHVAVLLPGGSQVTVGVGCPGEAFGRISFCKSHRVNVKPL